MSQMHAADMRTHRPRRDGWTIAGVAVVAAAAIVASFTAQAGLGVLAGWVASLEVFDLFEVRLSWLLPLCVDAYGATATRIAVNSSRYSAETRRHALIHAIGAVVVSVVANAMFHSLEAKVLDLGESRWVLVVAVSVVPPVALGALAHLMALCARDDAEARAEVLADQEADEVVAAWRAPASDGPPVADVPEPVPDVPERAPLLAGLPVLGPIEGFPRAVLAAGDEPRRVVVSERVPEPRDVPEDVPELYLRAVEHFAGDLDQGRIPPYRRIKDELHIGQDKAQEVRAYLAARTRT